MGPIIDQMWAAGTAPSAATCSILLRSATEHSHLSDVQRVMELMDEMQEPVGLRDGGVHPHREARPAHRDHADV